MHSVITDVSLSIHFANHSRHFISFLLFGHISSLCVVLKISGQRRVLCIIFCIVISFALSLIQNAILTIREVFWKPYHIVLEYGTPIEQTIALDKRIVLAFSCANSEHTEKDRMRKKRRWNHGINCYWPNWFTHNATSVNMTLMGQALHALCDSNDGRSAYPWYLNQFFDFSVCWLINSVTNSWAFVMIWCNLPALKISSRTFWRHAPEKLSLNYSATADSVFGIEFYIHMLRTTTKVNNMIGN